MCNFATLLGLWLTYESSPVPVQAKFGRILLLCGAVTSIIGYVIFAIFVVKAQSTATRQKDTKEVPPPENVSRPRLDALARKLGIYIGSAGVAAQVIGDTLTVRLTVFTCTNIELRFIRAVLNTGIGEVVLESSEPHRIVPFMELEKTFTKTLTPDEARRAPNWASTITISGKAKFEDHIEKDFSFGSALSQPALSRPT
jgi:hypothetical protein